jgi:hypothetical protein
MSVASSAAVTSWPRPTVVLLVAAVMAGVVVVGWVGGYL